METRDPDTDDPAEEAPPGWVLNTPTRPLEVWTYPVLALLLAAAHVVVGVVLGGALALVVGVSAAIIITFGAVALFITGRHAYDEQTRVASWRSHVTRVVVVATAAVVVAITSSLVGSRFGLLVGVGAAVGLYTTARAAPRFDHLVAAWASTTVAVACATLAVVGLTVESVPESLRAAWIASAVFALFATLLAAGQFRIAARTPPGQEPFSAPNRTAS
ncbi:hypothetical protein [Curtobacterium sp. MCSS17_005]|uniref:hypothetical protein n=1 Tax=Curtobacterium sp. MCSS17_005 TaxID=2175641 RepID=UPI000DA7CAB6|nr:hypothetical protein [Curtobacterium sp. MCSS17_005]WIB33015.1 hypothetical protein DEJ20_00740 [Curtobacterium sp. MCSS17_005]